MRSHHWIARGTHLTAEWRYLAIGLLVLDSVGLLIAQWLAYGLRFESPILPYSGPRHPELYQRMALVLMPVWLLLFWAHGLYRTQNLLGGAREYALVVNASTYATVAIVVLDFFLRPEGALSRGWLILVWAFSILLVGLKRFAARRVAYYLRRCGFFIRRAIIAGADEQGITLAGHLAPSHRTGVEVVGFVHDYLAPGSTVRGGFRVLGQPMDLDVLACRQRADLIIVVPGGLSWESMQTIMQLAAKDDAEFECRLLPGHYDVVASRVDVDARGPVPLLALNHLRVTGIERILKGAMDYTGAALLLVLSLPIAALLGVFRLSRPGPLLQGREFVGARGKRFRALAFGGWWNGEVMRQEGGLERFLGERRFHRLPGLLNVLRGEMSLVGPRRLTAADLSMNPKWRQSVLSVKPGLTGPWLLAGGEQLGLEESLRLDLYYVRNYSIWLDLQILFTTILCMKDGFGPRARDGLVRVDVAEAEPIVPVLAYQRES